MDIYNIVCYMECALKSYNSFLNDKISFKILS